MADGGGLAAYRAVGTLYNALMTALVLGLITRRGEETARNYVFRKFRRQHVEKFLPGLHKLGIAGEPDAPACALYHYHSNALGGVKTGYLRESDRKAWVRYPPPRWIWRGTAIAAVPHSVSAAMLHGWHGHNGVSLKNPRLGFVCTGMTVDGMPGLEGYYLDYGHPPRLGAGIPPHHAAHPAGASGARRCTDRTRPRRAPGRIAVPRGDGAGHGSPNRCRAWRPLQRPGLRPLARLNSQGARRSNRNDGTRRRRHGEPDRLACRARTQACRSAKSLRCLERTVAPRRPGAPSVPEKSDPPPPWP